MCYDLKDLHVDMDANDYADARSDQWSQFLNFFLRKTDQLIFISNKKMTSQQNQFTKALQKTVSYVLY